MKTELCRFTILSLLASLAALLCLPPTARATLREWDGGANMDNNWTAPNNWVGNAAPSPGDDLLFTSGASHPNNNNDYPSGTTFNSIEFRGGGGSGYTVSGASIALNQGIRVENNSGNPIDHTVNNSLILNSNQTFTINNDVGILFLVGPINLSGRDLTFNVTAFSDARVQGVISGTGGLNKTNAGTLLLTANNSYTGSTTLNGGTLQINGVQPASPVVLNAGTLKGIGTVGMLASAGNGGPGSIQLSPGGSSGILTCSNVALNASTTVAVELNGTTPGSGYDQLSVNGSVTLNTAALSVTLGFTPAIGNTFTIINNDGADAVVGAFNALAEGAILDVGGKKFQITYAGGTGNDVVLTAVNPPVAFEFITRLTDGQMQLQATGGLSGSNYTIQAATSLMPVVVWSDLGTAIASGGGAISFTDTNAPFFPMRFYRLRAP
jgi:autotransporter-associated beta strand protein